MDHMEEEDYKFYWENKMLWDEQELDGSIIVESSSAETSVPPPPPPCTATAAMKNNLTARDRRRRVNESLYVLRSVVPNITKMDKASIVEDAIEYIQELREQEERIAAEIEEIEKGTRSPKKPYATAARRKAAATRDADKSSSSSRGNPCIEVTELKVNPVGDGMWFVSLACNKKKGITTVRLCEVFKSLSLKTATANMTSTSGRILLTLFVESDEGGEELKEKIERAIAEMDFPS